MDVSAVYDLIETADDFCSGMSSPIVCPFPTRPEEYLAFAGNDLSEDSQRANLNAFHNAKRCITSVVDMVLWNCGLLDIPSSNLPAKLEKLQKLGLIAPRIIRRLNQTRNQLEHDYAAISREQAEDAVDIAGMFFQILESFADTRYDNYYFENSEKQTQGNVFWVYSRDETHEEMEKGSGDLWKSQSPSGLFYEVYRRLRSGEPKIMPEIVQCRTHGRHSQEYLFELGFEELGVGYLKPEDMPAYGQWLKKMFIASH